MTTDVFELLEQALPESVVEYDPSDDSFYIDSVQVWKEASRSISSMCLTPPQAVELLLDALHELDSERYPRQVKP